VADIYDKLAVKILAHYDKQFPAAKKTMQASIHEASMPPHELTTILGRKSRFVMWEKNVPGGASRDGVFPLAIAQAKWGGNIRVANTYKAINRRLQGSAADLMKKAMVDAYESGIFDKIGYPHITVHDELDFSYSPDLHAGFLELINCVENCLKLKVPIKMGLDIGPDWGHVSPVDLG
jgi:DNA polymerase I-like protein with 3'-5' exonuclease and polymerase domains